MAEDVFSQLHDNQSPPTYRYFSGKEWKESKSGKVIPIISPIDGMTVGNLPTVSKEEMDEALTLASAAQPKWEATPLFERVKKMHLVADWIRQEEPFLTTLLLREIGKTTSEAKSEVIRTADLIDYFADEAVALRGETLESDHFPGYEKGRTAIVDRVAHGTVLCIAPFNYPVNLAASKIAPALLMGNTVVFKPPTQGGIAGVHLAQLFLKAGLPEGVLTCLTGSGADVGDYLTTHPNIQMIAFTGSSDTGAHIAGNVGLIPLLFECGGNNPTIVLPDADMEVTAREIIKGGFSYAGQRCTAIKYVLGMQSTLDSLMPVILANMKESVVMGDPRNPATKLVGPVISRIAAEGIQKIIDEAITAGAKVIIGGKTKDSFVEPTILTGVTPSMRVVTTEVFGPVISFITVSSVDEAIATVNHSTFGLQACVFSRDEGAALVVAQKLAVGTSQINGSPQRGPDHFPFMGIKRSGLGVQGVKYSLEAMSRLRSVVINKPI